MCSSDLLTQTAARLLGDPSTTSVDGAVTVTAAPVDLDRDGLQELSRLLTREPDRVALLAGEKDGRGTLFVGSTSPSVSAVALVEVAKPLFSGRGGGNPSAATAVGEPGGPLRGALAAARTEARRMAVG